MSLLWGIIDDNSLILKGENDLKIISIEYPTALSEIEDINNDNIDVFVTLDDGITYVVVVFTPINYYWCMENENIDYFNGCPNLIVKVLTEDNIRRAIEACLENDAYWLKFQQVYGTIRVEELDEIIKKSQLE